MEISRRLRQSAWLVTLPVVWELIVRSGAVSPLLLPPLKSVLAALRYGVLEGALLLQLLQSVGVIAAGLGVGLLLAVVLAYADYFHPVLRDPLELTAAALHPLPGIALFPIVVIWAGIGLRAVFIIILHAVVWSLYLSIRTGFRTVDAALVEAALNEGASRTQLFRHVLVPCSRSAFLTGLQIGWSRGWRSLIGAEMVFGAISSVGGIGWYLFERRTFMDTPGVYAGLLLIILTGVLVEQAVFRKPVQ